MAKTNWKYDDIVTEADMNALGTELNANTTKLAESTSAAAANRLPIRDSNGRFKVGAPMESDDVARKDTVDNAIMTGIHRQAMINGGIDVWQRGTTFTNPGSGYFTADRYVWASVLDGGSNPTLNHTRQPLTPGDIPHAMYFYRLTISAAGSGYGANSLQWLGHKIEYGTRYLCGAGKKITVSFWARSNINNKKIGLWLRQGYGTGGAPSPSEFLNGANWTLTSSWTKYSITFNMNTLVGKTFGTNDDDQIEVSLAFQWGATLGSRVNSSTLETFGGSGNIDFAQIQVNAGESSLPFQPRSYGEELVLCQRYYEKSYDPNTVPGTLTTIGRFLGHNVNSRVFATMPFKVRKRIPPTIICYSPGTGGIVSDGFSSFETGIEVNKAVTSVDGSFGVHWVADAEL